MRGWVFDVTMFANCDICCCLHAWHWQPAWWKLESHSDSFRHNKTMLRKRTNWKNSEMVIDETFGPPRHPPSR